MSFQEPPVEWRGSIGISDTIENVLCYYPKARWMPWENIPSGVRVTTDEDKPWIGTTLRNWVEKDRPQHPNCPNCNCKGSSNLQGFAEIEVDGWYDDGDGGYSKSDIPIEGVRKMSILKYIPSLIPLE